MTAVRPFRAVRYDTGRVALSDVIVPPYDVIADAEREAYYERDPHNAIRFELTRTPDEDRAAHYARIPGWLADWCASGVLMRDEEPGYYVMRQRFTDQGETFERIGFFGELGIEDYSAGVVRRHEKTLEGPKADRLELMRATRANLSTVFLLYEDREQTLAKILERALEQAEIGTARDGGGVEYTLARLTEPRDVETLREFMAGHDCVIADGHHRYETALNYRNERREAGAADDADCASTLAYFANAYAPGSLLLPIHRVVKEVAPPADADAWLAALPGWSCERIAVPSQDDIPALLEKHLEPLAGRPAFAADDAKGELLVFSRSEPLGDDLMVVRLEQDVLGGVFGLDEAAIRGGAVDFPKSAAQAATEVRAARGTVALYLNALSPDDVFRVTRAGDVMPQKSTFFYPKVPTGMVFRVHDDAGVDV